MYLKTDQSQGAADQLITEIRNVRTKTARDFGYDARAYGEYLRERQQARSDELLVLEAGAVSRPTGRRR